MQANERRSPGLGPRRFVTLLSLSIELVRAERLPRAAERSGGGDSRGLAAGRRAGRPEHAARRPRRPGGPKGAAPGGGPAASCGEQSRSQAAGAERAAGGRAKREHSEANPPAGNAQPAGGDGRRGARVRGQSNSLSVASAFSVTQASAVAIDLSASVISLVARSSL